MKYEKPQAEVLLFDYSVFMTGSSDDCPNYAGYGHECGTYTKGELCLSWKTISFGGGSCSNYNGKKCSGYSDGTHTHCADYGISCSKF